MITILCTSDPGWVVAVGDGATVDVVATSRLPRAWRLRVGPNVLTAGAMGLAQAAAALAGLTLTRPAQAIQLQDAEVAPGAAHPALRAPVQEVPHAP